MNEIDVARHSSLIDPHLHVWGWEIPVYLFLGGMAAGIMILGALLGMRRDARSAATRWLAFAPAALLSVGMLALFLDLAHKLHVWRFYLAFRWTSPMSWGAWILVVVYPVSLLLALGDLDERQAAHAEAFLGRFGLASLARVARAFASPRLPALRLTSIGIGVGLGVYTGILLSTLGARALWSSALLGPLFLVSGVSPGAALMMLFPVSEEERHALGRWDLAAIGVELLLIALWLAGLATSGAAARDAAALVLGGPFTAQFWTVVVAAGLLVPALLEALEARLALRFTLAAPALVLAGGFGLRWILVAAGQA
jgi:formate-dependent nitrite reductase membrane component NrfD